MRRAAIRATGTKQPLTTCHLVYKLAAILGHRSKSCFTDTNEETETQIL